jgi:ATP-dependent DNA helicase Rep
MMDWLKEIDYEKHLYDGEDSEKAGRRRWTNVLEFCDWMAQRCGGRSTTPPASPPERKEKPAGGGADHLLLSTISEREQDQNVVTLSTLHAPRGWSGRM